MFTDRLRQLACLGALALCLAPAGAGPQLSSASATATVKFAPVPVVSIFRPLQAHGSADEALASGRVVPGSYAMAPKASKHWRIAFLFPHLKDPYWTGCATA